MVGPLLRVPAMPAPPAIEAAMISGGLRPSCRPGGGQCDVSPGGLELRDAPLWAAHIAPVIVRERPPGAQAEGLERCVGPPVSYPGGM